MFRTTSEKSKAVLFVSDFIFYVAEGEFDLMHCENDEKSQGKQNKEKLKRKVIIITTIAITVILATIAVIMYNNLKRSEIEFDSKQIYNDYLKINESAISIENKYASNGFVQQEDLSKVLDELEVIAKKYKSEGLILNYDKQSTSIYLKLNSGVGYLYTPTVEDLLAGDDVGKILTIEPYVTDLNFVAHYLSGGKSPDKAGKEIVKALPNSYSFSEEDNWDSFLPEQVEQIANHKIIIWYGHGGYVEEYGSVLGTSISIKDQSSLLFYQLELSDGEMILGKENFLVSPAYFDNHLKDNSFDGSLVYLSACESARDNRLAEVFINKGASLVVGSSRTIRIRYMLYMMSDFMSALTNQYDNGSYWTAEDALEYAKKQNGNTDSTFWASGAEVRLIYPEKESGYRLYNSPTATDDDFKNLEKMLKECSFVFNLRYNGDFNLEDISVGDVLSCYLTGGGVPNGMYTYFYDETVNYDKNGRDYYSYSSYLAEDPEGRFIGAYKLEADKADWIIENVFEKSPDRSLSAKSYDYQHSGYYYKDDYLYISGELGGGPDNDYKIIESYQLDNSTYGFAVLEWIDSGFTENPYDNDTHINYYVAKLKEDKDIGRYWCILKGSSGKCCFTLPDGASDKTKIFTEYTNALTERIEAFESEIKSTYNSTGFPIYLDKNYTVYDIDGDGTKELIIELGSGEADRRFYVYTFKNNKAVYCGYIGGTHSGLYIVKGKLYRFSVSGGNWEEYKINLQNKKVSEILTFSKYYEVDYEKREGTYIEMSENTSYTELVEELLLKVTKTAFTSKITELTCYISSVIFIYCDVKLFC